MQVKLGEYEKFVRWENEQGPDRIEDVLLRRDIYNYLCHVFWTYWKGGNLDIMLHPGSDVTSSFARAMVANSFGRIACDSMIDHIEAARRMEAGQGDNLTHVYTRQ